MKQATKEFIINLLEREVEAEYIQDSKNILEIEYVNDLVKAYKDFVKQYGSFTDKIYAEEKIEMLYKEV